MQATQGSLTILNAHTAEPSVFWNGQQVPVVGFIINNDGGAARIVMKVKEDPVLAQMQAAGIVIRRVP